MPNINDRIGSQNVIRVLSNASAPPTRLVNLTDIDSSRKSEDGMILVWDLSTEKFFMTDAIDSASLTVTGIATVSNITQSTSTTTGALVVSGGVGIAKEVYLGEGITVAGISTFSSALDINAAVDILNELKVNQTFESVGITTLASSGGITTTGGNLFVGSNLTVANNLKVDGTSEFIGNATFRGGTIGIGDSTGDDIDIGGEFVSNLVPNADNTYDIGITTQRWRDGKFAGLVTSTNLNVSGIATIGTLGVTGLTTTQDLRVAGLSTFVGIATFSTNVFVAGTLDAGLIDGGEF